MALERLSLRGARIVRLVRRVRLVSRVTLLTMATLGATALAACGDAGPPARSPHTLAGATASGAPELPAVFYPARHRAEAPRTPIVMFEPLLLRREILTTGHDGGLIGFLSDEGFPVWVVSAPAASAPSDLPSLGAALARTVETIARETGWRELDLAGVSSGGAAVLYALDALERGHGSVHVRKVAFLGTGFDYAYPHSFAAHVEAGQAGEGGADGKAPATNLCALEKGTACDRFFADGTTAKRWVQPLPGDPLATHAARERFPFVARFRSLPVFFVVGKVDGVAPSESVFPLYKLWGESARNDRKVPKRFFLAGRENGFGHDYDQLALLTGDDAASEVWTTLEEWLTGDR